MPPCLHGLGVQSSTSVRSEQVRQIKCCWISSSECVCVPSYWFRTMGRSSRLHSDTRNPDWSLCTSLHSHKGWTDRRVQLWTQAYSITCLQFLLIFHLKICHYLPSWCFKLIQLFCKALWSLYWNKTEEINYMRIHFWVNYRSDMLSSLTRVCWSNLCTIVTWLTPLT